MLRIRIYMRCVLVYIPGIVAVSEGGSVVQHFPGEVPAVLPADGDRVVEAEVGLLPRLRDAPGRIRVTEEQALSSYLQVGLDARTAVRVFIIV